MSAHRAGRGKTKRQRRTEEEQIICIRVVV